MDADTVKSPLAVARSVEKLARTDPRGAADLLQRLAHDLQAYGDARRDAGTTARASLSAFATMTEGIAQRLRTGQVKSICGLERQVRRLLDTIDQTRRG